MFTKVSIVLLFLATIMLCGCGADEEIIDIENQSEPQLNQSAQENVPNAPPAVAPGNGFIVQFTMSNYPRCHEGTPLNTGGIRFDPAEITDMPMRGMLMNQPNPDPNSPPGTKFGSIENINNVGGVIQYWYPTFESAMKKFKNPDEDDLLAEHIVIVRTDVNSLELNIERITLKGSSTQDVGDVPAAWHTQPCDDLTTKVYFFDTETVANGFDPETDENLVYIVNTGFRLPTDYISHIRQHGLKSLDHYIGTLGRGFKPDGSSTLGKFNRKPEGSNYKYRKFGNEQAARNSFNDRRKYFYRYATLDIKKPIGEEYDSHPHTTVRLRKNIPANRDNGDGTYYVASEGFDTYVEARGFFHELEAKKGSYTLQFLYVAITEIDFADPQEPWQYRPELNNGIHGGGYGLGHDHSRERWAIATIATDPGREIIGIIRRRNDTGLITFNDYPSKDIKGIDDNHFYYDITSFTHKEHSDTQLNRYFQYFGFTSVKNQADVENPEIDEYYDDKKLYGRPVYLTIENNGEIQIIDADKYNTIIGHTVIEWYASKNKAKQRKTDILLRAYFLSKI